MYGQAILNKSLSARSSAHASLPQFGPVQRHTGPHCQPSDPFNHKIRRAEPHGWNGALFPFHATREQTTISQWVTGFMVNLESQAKLLCCAHCTAKRHNAAFKNKHRSKSDHHGIQRKERQTGHKASAPPSRAHGVANEPGECPATTHRD